jgi:hypothetical protein
VILNHVTSTGRSPVRTVPVQLVASLTVDLDACEAVRPEKCLGAALSGAGQHLKGTAPIGGIVRRTS